MQTWPPDVKKWKTLGCRRTQNYYQIWLAEKLSTWLLSSGQDFNKKFLDSKHVLKVYFKPSRKNKIFLFLPLPSKLASLKNDHLSALFKIKTNSEFYFFRQKLTRIKWLDTIEVCKSWSPSATSGRFWPYCVTIPYPYYLCSPIYL